MYSRAQVEKFRGVWNALDSDGSGAVDVEEILNAKVFSADTLKVTKAVFATIDTDRSGDVSLSELVKVSFPMGGADLRGDIVRYMRYLDARDRADSERLRAAFEDLDVSEGEDMRRVHAAARKAALAASHAGKAPAASPPKAAAAAAPAAGGGKGGKAAAAAAESAAAAAAAAGKSRGMVANPTNAMAAIDASRASRGTRQATMAVMDGSVTELNDGPEGDE
jgi:hypothetical protein